MKRIDAVFIDFQNSFLDDGSLGIKGGRQAAQNAAKVVNRLGKKITNIYSSLDSHQSLHVWSTLWYLDKNNQHPQPFTLVTYKDFKDGVYRATKRSLQDHTENYLKELEAKGRYVNCLWPRHCEINTAGWLLEEEFAKSLTTWETDNLRRVNYIAKGNNSLTECFSAFEAEVPQPDDPTTQLNVNLISSLEEADEIVWAGLAKSHCLRYSMQSVFDNFSNGEYLKKCVLLEDCTESVAGFEQQGDDFVKEMVSKGMKVSTSSDYLA